MAALTSASTTTVTTPAAPQPCNNPSDNVSEPTSTVFDTSEYFRISLRTRLLAVHMPLQMQISFVELYRYKQTLLVAKQWAAGVHITL